MKDQFKFEKFSSDKVYEVRCLKTGKRLPKTPARVFYYLMNNLGEFVDKHKIAIDIWGDDDYFIQRSFDVHLRKIRVFLKETDCGLEIGRAMKKMICLNKK